MCPSTTKYLSPLLSYMCLLRVTGQAGPWLPAQPPHSARDYEMSSPRGKRAMCGPHTTAEAVCGPRKGCVLRPGHQVEPDELGSVLRVGEHDRPVVLVDHPSVVRGHGFLELRGVEPPGFLAGRLGDLVVDHV